MFCHSPSCVKISLFLTCNIWSLPAPDAKEDNDQDDNDEKAEGQAYTQLQRRIFWLCRHEHNPGTRTHANATRTHAQDVNITHATWTHRHVRAHTHVHTHTPCMSVNVEPLELFSRSHIRKSTLRRKKIECDYCPTTTLYSILPKKICLGTYHQSKIK